MNMLKVLIVFLAVINIAYAKKGKNSCEEYPPKNVIAVLIDVSEPLDVPNKMAYAKISERIIAEAQRETRLDVYKIAGSTSGVSGPIISLCVPTSPSENKLLKGDKFWSKKIEKEFKSPISDVLSQLGENIMGGKESPIIESIFSMSVRSFISSGSGKNMQGKVIVISDFMQHSSTISFYNQSIPSYNDWRNSPEGRSWVRNFGNVEFEAIAIPRSGSSALPMRGRAFFDSYAVNNFSKYSFRDMASSISAPKD